MRSLLGPIVAGSVLCSCTAPPQPRPGLQARLECLLARFDGDVGVYARHLETGEVAAVAADALFPTASLIKVPILAVLMQRIQLGELDYHAPLVYGKDRLYPGEDLLGSFADGARIDVARLCMLMITMSDNTASLWCQELAGTGTAINSWLAAKGFVATRVNSRTPGRETAKEDYGWGQTTPREMAELVVLIREGRAVSPSADEEMQRILSRSFWDGEALAEIPPSVQVMSKQGAISHSRSEVALVHAPGGDYVFCVITKNQRDRSWDRDNAGFVLLRQVSAMLWSHFEPASTWAPAGGAERFW